MKFIDKRFWLLHLSDRWSEPLHLNLMSVGAYLFGGVRAKIAFDLYGRRAYAFGVLYAADAAKALGIRRIAVIEFGVASGYGLLALSALATRVASITGVQIDVFGFDTGAGLPPPLDYRDHPESYYTGDYSMPDSQALKDKLPANTTLILGDISKTVGPFLQDYGDVIGFVGIDVDYYTSTISCLSAFTGPAEKYLPITPIFLDDIAGDEHNAWCGELLAVHEFNARESMRKITPLNFLRQRRILKNAIWIDQMYALHVFDHPKRSAELTAPATPRVM